LGFPVKVRTRYTNNKKIDKLLRQLDDLYRFSHAGWSKTRKFRFHQFKVFLKFVAVRFEPSDIRNIKPSHVKSFVQWRRENKIRESTILSDLSTIRFWHRQIPLRRYDIPPNSVLLGKGDLRDRSWKRR